jgi:6-phosphofructokinase 1
VNNHTVLIPIPELVAKSPRVINNKGRTWDRVLAITGQPSSAPDK